jgi:hypothetical protein
VLITAALGVQCHHAANRTAPRRVPIAVEPAQAAALASHSSMADPAEQLVRSDPLRFLRRCRENYASTIDDYTCTFTKQERIRGKITPEQETRVKFRSQPYSVNMEWLRNAGDAAHVVYVEDRWHNKKGEEMAWCKPAGAIAKIFISKIQQPINGKRAGKASRRTIDQFGYANTLDLIIHYSEKAAAEGLLDLRYAGTGSIDGRPTYVFERLLPYTGEEQPYPDRLLVTHIDQEWLLPTACFSYADDEGQELLGKYLLTDASFNVGLTDADFGPEALD